jgi:protein SCO1/2
VNLRATLLAVALLAGCSPHGPAAPDFTLTADDNRPWTLSAQRGHAVLLTFGFTHCADTCPATLAKLAHLRRSLGDQGREVAIGMVSVDPRRDSPAVLHRFVTRFDGPIAGLTGSQSRVAAVESAYHVWAQQVPGRNHSTGYDTVHSAVIYVIDARGVIRGTHDDDEPEMALTSAVRDAL